MYTILETNRKETDVPQLQIALRKYYKESYDIYKDNAEYLFYVSYIGGMSEWYLNIADGDLELMTLEATRLEPQNKLFQWGYHLNNYNYSKKNDNRGKIYITELAKSILVDNNYLSDIKMKSILGDDILDLLKFDTTGIPQ